MVGETGENDEGESSGAQSGDKEADSTSDGNKAESNISGADNPVHEFLREARFL